MNLPWLCSVPLCGSICIVGLIGNIICGVVWYNIYKAASSCIGGAKGSACFLIVLSIADGGVLLFFILADTAKAMFPLIKENYAFIQLFAWFIFPLFFYFMVLSRWILIALTLCRYIMMVSPLKSNSIFTRKNTKISLIVMSILAVFPNIPFLFYFEAKETPTGFKLGKTEFGAGKGGITNEFWVHCIALVLIPFLSIAILNALILQKLMSRQRKMTKSSDAAASKQIRRNKRTERKITKLVLVVTFIFIALLFWQCVSKCFFMLKYGKATATAAESSALWLFVQGNFALSKVGLVLNSAINVLIYSIFGAKFRKHFLRLLCGACGQRNSDTCSSTSAKSKLSVCNTDIATIEICGSNELTEGYPM